MNWFTTLLINSLKHHGGLPKKIPVIVLNSFTHAETGDCLFGSPSYLPYGWIYWWLCDRLVAHLLTLLNIAILCRNDIKNLHNLMALRRTVFGSKSQPICPDAPMQIYYSALIMPFNLIRLISNLVKNVINWSLLCRPLLTTACQIKLTYWNIINIYVSLRRQSDNLFNRYHQQAWGGPFHVTWSQSINAAYKIWFGIAKT